MKVLVRDDKRAFTIEMGSTGKIYKRDEYGLYVQKTCGGNFMTEEDTKEIFTNMYDENIKVFF